MFSLLNCLTIRLHLKVRLAVLLLVMLEELGLYCVDLELLVLCQGLLFHEEALY